MANRFHLLEPYAPRKPLRARDQQTAQTVVLHPVRNLDPRLVGIFHPSLLTIFAIVEHDGQSLAACEFVPARPLQSVFGGEPCHPRRAAEIVSEIADGVAELHGHGIAHGGIAIGSVVLTTKGKARLTLTTAVGGTPEADLDALRALLANLGGHLVTDAARTDSAAVLAAALRDSWTAGAGL